MFAPVMESMSKMTEATMGLQQEMIRKWFSAWPGVPFMPGAPPTPGTPPAGVEQIQKFQKKWIETVSEIVRRQRETLEAQFKAGQQNIEKAFHLGEAKSTEELRARTIELWQKCFEGMRQASEAQIRDFQVAVDKWFELVVTTFPPP